MEPCGSVPNTDDGDGAPTHTHSLREAFNGRIWIVRAGAPWRLMPNDLPPWTVVYQQTRRWLDAGVFEAIVHDLRAVLRFADGRRIRPTAAILDSRTIQSPALLGRQALARGAALVSEARLGARAAGAAAAGAEQVDDVLDVQYRCEEVPARMWQRRLDVPLYRSSASKRSGSSDPPEAAG